MREITSQTEGRAGLHRARVSVVDWQAGGKAGQIGKGSSTWKWRRAHGPQARFEGARASMALRRALCGPLPKVLATSARRAVRQRQLSAGMASR